MFQGATDGIVELNLKMTSFNLVQLIQYVLYYRIKLHALLVSIMYITHSITNSFTHSQMMMHFVVKYKKEMRV